jgi:hypothetical protein
VPLNKVAPKAIFLKKINGIYKKFTINQEDNQILPDRLFLRSAERSVSEE